MDAEDCWYRGVARDAGRIADELRQRAELLAGDFSRWAGAGDHVFREELTANPERLFLFMVGDRWYAGRKTISDYVAEHNLPGLFCSRIRWFNVAGVLTGQRCSDQDVQVRFRPLPPAARRRVFDAVTPTTEIIHPFAKHEKPGQETGSPAEGWFVSRERAEALSLGESHIRRYTREVFAGRFAPGRAITAYDPACSTGKFLSEFAAAHPAPVRTIGQDLSAAMVEYARDVLDEVHHGNALEPRIAPRSADVVFSRFLNSEVVTTRQAREILPAVAGTVSGDGVLVLFGHTPVLVDSSDLAAQGLRVRQTTARQDDHLFQYYVCERAER